MQISENLKTRVTDFFHWWKKELAFLVPQKFRNLGGGVREQIFLRIQDSHFQLLEKTPAGEEELAVFSLDKGGKQLLERLFQEHPGLRKADIILELDHRQGLKKTISLPVATEENLRQVIVYELDRYTPFTEEQIYYDLNVLGKNKEGSQVDVELISTPKWKLESLLKYVGALGIELSAVRYQDSAHYDAAATNYNLLPEGFRRRENKGPKIANLVFWGCLVLLLVAAFNYPLWLGAKVVDDLNAKVRTAAKKVQEIEKIREETELLAADAQTVLTVKETELSIVKALQELTHLLPDDTSLKRFQYNDKRLQIQGLSPSASALIGTIEGSPLFSNTRFVSPVTQDRMSGLERFQIATDVAVHEDGDEKDAG